MVYVIYNWWLMGMGGMGGMGDICIIDMGRDRSRRGHE